MSAAVDPEAVMRSYLATPSMVLSDRASDVGSGWRSRTSTGGLDARPETIHVLKVRSLPSRRLYAVTYVDTAGRSALFFCHLRQDDSDVWRFEGGAGGGTSDGGPLRGFPWINLGAGGWPVRFYAGGTVSEDGALAVARVRLIAANGVALEDTVEDEIALFLTDEPVTLPVTAELLDASGAVMSRHVALG